MAERPDLVCWLHIGDRHITAAGEENRRDLLRIVDLMAGLARDSLDFAVLPGDNADDGTPGQFALVREAVSRLPTPPHILPRDHDFKPRTLDGFHDVLGAERLPKSLIVHGRRCLFLDVVSDGSGGPDVRMAEAQLAWIERELDRAAASGQVVAVFMHTYPADLRDGAGRLGALLARPRYRPPVAWWCAPGMQAGALTRMRRNQPARTGRRPHVAPMAGTPIGSAPGRRRACSTPSLAPTAMD